ncbi:MAG: amino acid ABC transporter permease [Phototrophicaceae bacterium]
MNQTEYSNLVYVAPKDAPPSRKPPAYTIGLRGWLLKNLFSTRWNGALSLFLGAFLVWFVWSIGSWSLLKAEWTVINNNLRLLLVGQYDQTQLGRVTAITLVMVALSGLSMGLWTRVARSAFLGLAVVVVLLFLVPLFSVMLPPPPIRYLVSAQQGMEPYAFVADAGDSVTLSFEQLTLDAVASPTAPFNGFLEAKPGLANSRTVFNDLRTAYQAQQLDLSVFDLAFEVRVVDATEAVIETIEVTGDTLNVAHTVTLPAKGWYALETSTSNPDAQGYVWIILDGVETFTTQAKVEAERIAEYGEMPPFICADGSVSVDCVREAAQRELRYEGTRTFSDYLTIQLSPFFQDIAMPTFIGVLVAGVGWFVGNLLYWRTAKPVQQLASRILLMGWLLLLPVSWVVFRGIEGSSQLAVVPSSLWGGLMLTLILTGTALVLALPIGILLALGRQNTQLGAISVACTIFIEVVRGVPLITILFFAKLILPFFISGTADIEQAVRMSVGLTLFLAAYVAEIIRGGLQIIPKGQTEAAQALGLSGGWTMTLIIMPQALRAVIPAIMSQFVSLFKDTTLVAVVGLFEFFGIIDFIVNGQQQYRPYVREAYLFVGLVYFIISFVMSAISRRLEQTGVGAARR